MSRPLAPWCRALLPYTKVDKMQWPFVADPHAASSLWRRHQPERDGARQAVDHIPMLGELAVLDAEKVGRREAQFVAGRRPALERAVLGTGPFDPGHHYVAFGDERQDLGAIVAEACLQRDDELLPALEA